MLVHVSHQRGSKDRCIWGDVRSSVGPAVGHTSQETAAGVECVLIGARRFVDVTVPLGVEHTVWGLYPGQT